MTITTDQLVQEITRSLDGQVLTEAQADDIYLVIGQCTRSAYPPISMNMPVPVMDQIYIAMCDVRDRTETGTDGLTQCINFLENERGFERPVDKRKIQNEDQE